MYRISGTIQVEYLTVLTHSNSPMSSIQIISTANHQHQLDGMCKRIACLNCVIELVIIYTPLFLFFYLLSVCHCHFWVERDRRGEHVATVQIMTPTHGLLLIQSTRAPFISKSDVRIYFRY